MNEHIYLHEVIDIIGNRRKDYFRHMTSGFNQAEGRAVIDLFGIWGTVGSTGRWPQVINLWEKNDWEHVAASFAQHARGGAGHQDPVLERWWNAAQEIRSGGFDRLLAPSADSLSLAQLVERGMLGWEVYRHEVIQLQRGSAREFLAAVDGELAPLKRGWGEEMVGAYRTLMRDDDEVVLISAIKTWEAWAQAERRIDLGEASLKWRAKMRGMIRDSRAEVMCSAPLSPTVTGRQAYTVVPRNSSDRTT